MPGLINTNITAGRREMMLSLVAVVDARQCVAISTFKKSSPGTDEANGIPNSIIGTYNAKVFGDRKGGGVADGKDVGAFDSNPPLEPLSFRPEKFRRSPMVGDLAKDDDVVGNEASWATAISDATREHKRDMEVELWSDQDSTPTGGLEGGSKTRAFGRWVNNTAQAGGLTYSELPVPSGAQTPANQIFIGSLGDGVTTGLTEAVGQGLLQARWENSGDSGQLTGYLGAAVKNVVGKWTRYRPNITGTTMVQLIGGGEARGTYYGASVDLFASDWGSFTLMAINSVFLPDQYRGYFLDKAQVSLRSRYWVREKALPDLGGGPRETIESFIALIPGDLRSHVKIAGSA